MPATLRGSLLKCCQKWEGPDPLSHLCQPMSAFSKTPLPPLSANVSIYPPPLFCPNSFVSIFNTTLSMNYRLFCCWRKYIIWSKLIICQDKFYENRYFWPLLNLLSGMSLFVRPLSTLGVILAWDSFVKKLVPCLVCIYKFKYDDIDTGRK